MIRPLHTRGVSPVIGTILLVGIVIILSTAALFAFSFTNDIQQPSPVVSQSSGELVPQSGFDGGVVHITHQGGDTLDVSTLKIVVDARDACGKSGRLVNLPAPGGDPIPTSEYVRGDDIFDNGYNEVGGPIGEAGGQWTAGETIQFRIAGTPCQLDTGDSITVYVVHTPTNAIIIENTLSS